MFSRTWWIVLAFCGCDASWVPDGDPEAIRVGLARYGADRDPDTLVIGRASDAIALDPALPTDSESAEVIEQIFDKLVHAVPGERGFQPGLAVAWHAEAGGREWIFELRRGVVFHDGTPLDADAVVFSLERQRDPGHPYYRDQFHSWRTAFANVQAVEKLDDYRVRITIERPYAPLLANMAMFPVAIVSPTAVARHRGGFSRHPVGTGPYRMVSWRGGRIVLEQNERYWGTRPRLRRLVFQTIPDHRQRLIALESGAIDIAHSILPEELQFVELHPRLELYRTTHSSVTYLALNGTQAPLDDVRVRRAINHAINKEPIVKVLWQGTAEVAHSPLSPHRWGYWVEDTYDYDPAAARALLAAAAADGRFDPGRPLRLYVTREARPHLPSPERLGRALAANLRDVGVTVELVSLPFVEFRSAVKNGVHDLAIHGWVSDNGDPDNVLFVLFSRNNAEVGRASNVAFYRDPEVQGLLSMAQEAEERREREALYGRVQILLHEHAPWVPLAHSQIAVAARRDVAGVTVTPTGAVRFQDVYRLAADRALRGSRAVR